jgi:hypothetical protein
LAGLISEVPVLAVPSVIASNPSQPRCDLVVVKSNKGLLKKGLVLLSKVFRAEACIVPRLSDKEHLKKGLVLLSKVFHVEIYIVPIGS